MPIYNLNNRRYNIPDDVVNDFERDNPDATIAYNADGNIYDIPVSKKQGFLQKFPDATLHDDLPQAEGQVVNNTISGGVGTQEEADSLFELNAARFNEKDPIKRAALDMQYNQFENSLKEKQNQQLRDHLEESGEIKRLQEVQGKAQLEIDKASFFDRFFNANTRAAVAARDVAEEALETYSEANQKNDGWFDKNVGGVLRGFFDKVGDLRTWDFGASGISSAVALKDASEKLERGEALTPTEQNMLDAYGLSAAVQAAYQEKVGTAYRVGGSLPESFAFGASLAINPAGGVGKKIAETAAKAAVKKYGTGLVSKLAKGAARVGGDIVEMGVATAVPGAGRVAEDYYNRLNGQSTFDIDNNGIIRYGGQVEQEEADDAIWKAFGSQFIENYSEAMGNYFAPMGTMLSNLTSKGLKAGGLGKLAEAVSDISSSQWSKGLQRFKDAVKFDGLVGEYLEEVAGNFMNAATVGDMNFNSPEDPRSVFNPDTNIETFLSCALLSGTMYAVEAPITLYNKHTAKKNLRNADSAASSLLGNRWEDLRNQMDSASPEHLAQILTGVQNAGDLSNEQKQAVKEYASRLMQSQGFNARNVQNAQETTPETAEANNAYNEGSENDAPQYVFKANRERVKAGNALKAVDENVASVIDTALETGESVDVFINSLDENVAPLARDYYNKSLRMRGVIDGVMDRAEDAIAEEEKIIRSVTDPSTGMYTEISRLVTNPQTGEREAQPGYVVGWIGEGENRMPTFLPEGVENIPENRVPLKPTEFDAASIERLPMNEVLSLNAEMIRERAKKDLNDKASMAEQVYNYVPKNEDQVIGADGQVLTVTGVTPDGIVYANEQGQVEQMSLDEWKGLMQAQLDAQEAAQAEAAKVEESNQSIVEGLGAKPMEDGTGRVMQPKGVQGNEVVYDITDGNGTVLEEGSMDAAEYNGVGEESKVSGQVSDNIGQGADNIGQGADNIGQTSDSVGQERTEAPVIPTKEDGSIDFVSYGKEGTFKALGEKYGEKMPNKVAVTAKALADDLAKAQKKLDKAIEDYDNAPIGREDKAEKARDKAQQELDAIKRESDFWAEMDTEIKDAQFRRASMLNPQAETETSNEPMNADEFVAQQISTGNIVLNKEDYKRETGYGDAEANAMNGGAAKIFGENGMTIQEAGERLMEMDRENGTNFFDQTDSNAGRDALISLLGNVKSRKELNQYIASNRAEQAKNESEGLRNELERSVMDANYASLEDYVLQMEASEMENPFADVNADEILAIFAEAVEEYNNYLNPQENGQGTTEESIEGNGELLSEEQSGDTGGTEVRQESARNGEGAAEESETADAATEVELKQQEGETPLQFAERAAKENERRAPLRKRVKEWEKLLGVKVNVIENPGGVRNKEALRYIAKGKNPSGWVESNGEVAIYLPGVSNVDEVDKTIIHEVVAHKGLRGLLGKERFDELCDKVWAMMSEAKRAEYYDYVGDRFGSKEERQRAAADEYMAFLSEEVGLSLEEKTIWDNIVKMFRELLDKALNGIISKSKLTDADIAELIKASYANLKSGAERLSKEEQKGARIEVNDDFFNSDFSAKDAKQIDETLRPGKVYGLEKVEELFYNYSTDKEQRALAKRVFEVAEKLDLKIEFLHTDLGFGIGGIADGDTIKYSRIATLAQNKDKLPDVLLHEVIHSVTLTTINAYKNKELNNPKLVEAVEEILDVYNNIKGNESLRGEYGLKNEKEMIAEIANPSFRDKLRKINLWEKLKSAIKKIFFFDEKKDVTAERVLSEALDKILDNFDFDLFDAYERAQGYDESDWNFYEFGGYQGKAVGTRFRVVKDKNGKKTLVGLHNISEAKLKKAIKQGGLANPSVAVIDMDKQSHVDYGDITLVLPESMIDKKSGKNVGTYMADAYTPIYPTVVKQMTDKGYKVFNKALDDVNEFFRSKVRSYFNSYLDTGTIYDALYYWYLSDTGKNPPTLEAALPSDFTREEVDKVKSINPESDSFFQLSEEDKQKALALYAEKFYNGIEAYKEYLADYIKRMQEVVKDESKPAMVRNRIQKNLSEIENYGFEYDYVAAYYNRGMQLASRQSKPSDVETFSNARNEVVKKGLNDEFNQWLANKESDLGVEEKLFKGYDNQGRAKYVPNTLENASKLMKKEGRAGATGYGGFNEFVAVLAPVAKTTKELNKKKQNLSTKEAYDEFVEQWSGHYHDLAQKLQPGADKWADYGYHRLQEIAPMANPRDYVKREYGIELSEEFMKDLNDIKTAIKNDFPARYFETKFERPVYLNEFVAAVVPQGTSKDVLDALTGAGLPVEEYESGNNEARMAAIDKVSSEIEGTRFRISEKGKQIQAEVDKFTSKYNSKPVVLVDSEMTEEELHDVFPEVTLEEVKEAVKEGFMGGYSSETGKIYIFVDNQPLDDLDNTMFHENLHGILEESSEFVDEFYANASDKLPKLKAKLERLGYKKEEIPEEMFVRVATSGIIRGELYNVRYYLNEGKADEYVELLNKFGYEQRTEANRRILEEFGQSSSGTSGEERKTGTGVQNLDQGEDRELQEATRRERKERLTELFNRVADTGLQGVLGNETYDRMMMDIYSALPEDSRKEIIEDAFKNYGATDFVPAVSDYIGAKADGSLWDKIVTIVREALRKVGFDLDLNANEVRYLAWRSKKPLDRNNLLEVAEDIDMKNRLKVGEYDGTTPDGGGTRFRAKKTDPIDVSDERPQIIKDYDNELQTKSFNFQEAFQDRMLSVKVLMDKIVEATGKKVRSFEDVYKAENELGSTNRPAQLKYIEEFFNPLVKKVQELSDEYGHEAVRRYIYCKSGLERNEVLRQRDADEAYNEAKEEMDGKLASGSITQRQYNALLKLADKQRKDTLSKDIDYSGIRGLLFNSRVAEVEKDYQDGKIDKQTRDVRINGLKSSKEQIMSGWKKFAEDQVFYLEQKAGQKKLDELWDKINAATNETLRIDFESGMIDRDTYNAEKNMMKYYVPLRNWKDTVAEDMYEYRHDMTPAVSSNQKRAEGRKSEADNPIATIGLMAQNAIVRGNRNKMKMKLYAFVSNRDTPLASIRNVWYEKDATGTWIPKYADTSKAKSEAEMKQILDQFEQNMEALAEQGMAFKGKAKFGMGFRANRSQKDEHVVTVMINGKEYGIYINGNPRAAQAVNGMTNAEGIDDGYAWVDKLKRLYGGGLTSWNPDFIIPNLVRDTIHASTMTFLDRGVLGSLQYMANIPKIFAQVSAEVSGLSTGNPKLHQYFEEFVANGGETGYTEIHTLEDYKKEYKKLINEAKGLKPSLKNGFEKIAKILEAANRIAEDVNRFNAYVTSRESGENIVNSVDAAKNITVNFNRKGALHANSSVFGKVASFMSRWILFFNPSVQGIHQIVTKSKLNPKRATALGATIIASGFIMPMLNEMLVAAFGDGDDDDYWNQSDYKRRNNWMLFTGDGYVSIPLPPVLREIYGMGDIIYGVMTGHIPPQRAIYDVMNQVQSAISFVTLLPEVSQEPDVKTWLKGFAPDLASPFLDVMSNTNFMGRPIAKWTDYNETDPEYERVYKGVGKQWVEVSKFLNEVGGNETRRSDWWGNMINPAMMEHLVTSYTGGIGKTINNFIGMTIDAVEGDKENMDVFRKAPIVPRFYTPNDEKTVYPGINRKFYEFEYQYNNAKKSLKKANEGVASGEHPEWQKYIDEMEKNGEKKFIEYFKAQQKKLKKLQDKLKENPNNKELEKQVYDKKAEIATESFKILSGQK